MNKMKINWKIIVAGLFLIVAVIVIADYFSFRRAIVAPNENITQNTLIQIKADETAQQIGTDLAALGLVANGQYFYYFEKFSAGSIKPGYYEITPKMSTQEVADLLNSGRTKIVKVTIPEGYRLEQIARKIAAENIVSYTDFITAAKGKEGTLFPDTYFFNPRMTGTEVITKMTDNYTERTTTLHVSAAQLVLASIVEKEAANDTDRAIIAGIYSNRIKLGMKLQSDPTVSYGRDTNNLSILSIANQISYDFWQPAKTVEFTSVRSAFNTYAIDGLPPTPICDPGLASIQAAINPGANSYYYFLYGRDGKLYPARTQTEHNANVAKYL